MERASHDPKAVITTYEGKHNHNVPTARNSSHEMAGPPPPTMSGISRMRPEDNDRISLDLGVGMSYGSTTDSRTNGQLNMLDQEPIRGQVPPGSAPGRMMVQASPFSACYGVVNGGSMTLYGSRENLVQNGSGFETAPLQPSNQCQQNLGRVLLGP